MTRYPTGSIGIDKALGGGWEAGTLNEVWGDPGAAKTVLALHTTETFVRARKEVVWFDLNDGVRHMDSAPRVIVARPRSAEELFLIAGHACRFPEVGLLVVDPTQHIVRQREIDGDDTYVPHPQREYRVELSDLKRAAKASGTVVLFIGQPRDKDRQPVRGTGISEKVSNRVHLHPDVVHQDGRRKIQAVVKNVATREVTYDAAKFEVNPGLGIDKGLELAQMAVDHGQVEQRGQWYHPRPGMGFQGVRQLARALNGDSQLFWEIDKRVREYLGIS